MADAEVSGGSARRWSELVASLPAQRVTEYHSFSPKLAPGLYAAGGALTILGALGTWIRVTESEVSGDSINEVDAIVGSSETFGWALAVLGLLVAIGGLAWGMQSLKAKLVPLIGSLVVIGIVARKLMLLEAQSTQMITQASVKLKEAAESTIYAAYFGWGAWLLLAGSVMLFLGTVAGILRELDTRRGLGE